ncbi:PREDICTED: uncharacterized protein LOC105853558 isoform X3 [Condylura cristata]|uniref:uncharacterized protein LOC105853558 isoform X3 n=1 Tax=Condylura cristata TaxID=143302 RepID=UPI0006435B5C|nr:PREDICTED: uncharacterized protein LOC105853558 isoform X3 [Condylura cristata]
MRPEARLVAAAVGLAEWCGHGTGPLYQLLPPRTSGHCGCLGNVVPALRRPGEEGLVGQDAVRTPLETSRRSRQLWASSSRLLQRPLGGPDNRDEGGDPALGSGPGSAPCTCQQPQGFQGRRTGCTHAIPRRGVKFCLGGFPGPGLFLRGHPQAAQTA